MSSLKLELMKSQFRNSQKNYTQIHKVLESSEMIEFNFSSSKERIEWVKQFLDRVRYKQIKTKKDKGVVIEILRNVTHSSERSIFNWLRNYKRGKLKAKIYKRHTFAKKYNLEDILLLVEVDEATERISASSLKKLFEREYKVFKKEEFVRLASISRAHINNLRNSPTYKSRALHFERTHSNHAAFLPIGKMDAKGIPGYLRVDVVHSGIHNEMKGLYFINIIDDVLQTEYIYTVPVISERYMVVVLEYLIVSFWTNIIAFHSDGGSEFNNSVVVRLLNELLIKEYNRSRPYHSNDNALIEMKNGYIIRKHFGFGYIPKEYTDKFNIYLDTFFNQYLNFHRSCGYLTGIHKSKKGRTIREYGYYNTPYELFKQKYPTYLKDGLTIAQLDIIAYTLSDYEAAKQMKHQKDLLFKQIYQNIIK